MPFLEEYTLLDELGQGGYATVYKVRHNKLGYIRAIRVLNAVIAHGEEDKTYQKFLEECRLLLRLGNGNHPNIVHIYQPLLRAGRAIVEMDYVDGVDLFHYHEKKSSFVEIGDVLKLLTDISGALAYCHEDIYKFCMDKDEDSLKDDPNDGSKLLIDDKTRQRLIKKYRVIHNDIHSGNIIRKEDGNYVLLDFGLAIDGESVVRSSRRKNGAPEFKAPEKWDNDGVLTTQSDIYSFGIVMYEFLAGRVPFLFNKQNSNSSEAEYLLCKAHKEQQPESIFALRKEAFERTHPGEEYKQDYPQWLEDVIMKCLAKKPEDRFKNGKELFSYVKEHIANHSEIELLALREGNEYLQEQLESLQDQLKDVITGKQTVDAKIEELWNKNFIISSERDILKKEIQTLRTQKHSNKWWKITTAISIFICVIFIYMDMGSSPTTTMEKDVIAIPAGDDNVYIPIESAQRVIKERDSLKNILRNFNKNTSTNNNTIIEYKKQVSEKEKHISELASQVQDLNLEISNLKLKLSRRDETATNVIADKDKTINQLRKQIEKLNHQIVEKNKLIDILNKQIGIN